MLLGMAQLAFFVSIAFSTVAWAIVTARYIWPELRLRQRSDALRPLLVLHCFRFIGMSFLVSGVVSPDLPSAFAMSAGFGDLNSPWRGPRCAQAAGRRDQDVMTSGC
jgi:hypothetical protein